MQKRSEWRRLGGEHKMAKDIIMLVQKDLY